MAVDAVAVAAALGVAVEVVVAVVVEVAIAVAVAVAVAGLAVASGTTTVDSARGRSPTHTTRAIPPMSIAKAMPAIAAMAYLAPEGGVVALDGRTGSAAAGACGAAMAGAYIGDGGCGTLLARSRIGGSGGGSAGCCPVLTTPLCDAGVCPPDDGGCCTDFGPESPPCSIAIAAFT